MSDSKMGVGLPYRAVTTASDLARGTTTQVMNGSSVRSRRGHCRVCNLPLDVGDDRRPCTVVTETAVNGLMTSTTNALAHAECCS